MYQTMIASPFGTCGGIVISRIDICGQLMLSGGKTISGKALPKNIKIASQVLSVSMLAAR
jgi:hypothetical protein